MGQLQRDHPSRDIHSKPCLAVKEDEVEEGEFRPSDTPHLMTVQGGFHRMAVDGAVRPSSACMHTHAQCSKSCIAAETPGRCSNREAVNGPSASLHGKHEGSPRSEGACVCLANNSNRSGGDSEAEDSCSHEPPWGRRLCVCGGRDTWERAAKRFRLGGGGPLRGGSYSARIQGKAAAGGEPTGKGGASFDLDAFILEDFEDDAVSAHTE